MDEKWWALCASDGWGARLEPLPHTGLSPLDPVSPQPENVDKFGNVRKRKKKKIKRFLSFSFISSHGDDLYVDIITFFYGDSNVAIQLAGLIFFFLFDI